MNEVSRQLADFVVRATVQSGAVALTALALLPLLRGVRANVRHALLAGALLVAAIVPFVPTVTAARTLPVRVNRTRTAAVASAQTATTNSIVPRVHASAPLVQSIAIAYALFLVYACASLLLALRHAARLRADAVPVAVNGVAVLLSARVRTPVTIGFLQPSIVLPSDLPADSLDAVIGHELAHVRRRDALVQLLIEVATLPIAFHPLVIWLKRELAIARELACDAFVAPALVEPRHYARVLVAIARQAASPRGALAFGAAATLERRLRFLRERPRNRGIVAATLLALAVTTVAYAAWRTPLHVFGLTRNDITGRWVLDRHATIFGTVQPYDTFAQSIAFDGVHLASTQTRMRSGRRQRIEWRVATDGVTRPIRGCGVRGRGFARWDGNQLVLVIRHAGHFEQTRATLTDANTLVCDGTIVERRNRGGFRFVFRRVKEKRS
jgi:beta-lactamase regulating signal transducer with metallopeptidase domain